MLAPLAMTGCSGPHVRVATLKVQKYTLYTGSVELADDAALRVVYLPKALRPEKDLIAVLSYERRARSGAWKRNDIQIRKLEGGGTLARATLLEQEKTGLYLDMSHSKTEHWTVGLRTKWKF